MNKTLLTIIVIIAIVVVGVWAGNALWGETISEDATQPQERDTEEIPTSLDTTSGSKEEGSSTSQTNPQTVQARLNQEASALGVTIVPREVTEDSRCPADVTCVWAGTVHLQATVEYDGSESSEAFVLGESMSVGETVITLTVVEPEPVSTQTISPSEYVFTFTVETQ